MCQETFERNLEQRLNNCRSVEQMLNDIVCQAVDFYFSKKKVNDEKYFFHIYRSKHFNTCFGITIEKTFPIILVLPYGS